MKSLPVLMAFQMHSWNRARSEFTIALEYMPEAVITNTAIQRSYLLAPYFADVCLYRRCFPGFTVVTQY